jgi:hypothetical protein
MPEYEIKPMVAREASVTEKVNMYGTWGFLKLISLRIRNNFFVLY